MLFSNSEPTSSDASCCFDSLAIQVPNVLSGDAHVFSLAKRKATFATGGTCWVEAFLTSLQVNSKQAYYHKFYSIHRYLVSIEA